MIERILAPNPGLMTGTGTNTYLVGEGMLAVVDPGPADPGHIDAVIRAARPLGRIEAVLVTHGHMDHLPGAGLLCQRTGARLVGHAALSGVDKALVDGEEVRLDGTVVVALETPGHTSDSLSYWLPEQRALFTGDLVAGAGTVIVDDSPGGLARYMASLRRLLGLGRCAIYPGHGPIVEDGPAKLQEYVDHREGRERQVLEALAEGPRSVEGIVEVVYPDVVPGLRAMAARNVRAHLDKLQAEGRAEPVGAGWRRVEAAG